MSVPHAPNTITAKPSGIAIRAHVRLRTTVVVIMGVHLLAVIVPGEARRQTTLGRGRIV
jgi:cytochrome b561